MQITTHSLRCRVEASTLGNYMEALSYEGKPTTLGARVWNITSIRIFPFLTPVQCWQNILSHLTLVMHFSIFPQWKREWGCWNLSVGDTVIILYCWDFSTQFVYCCRISDFPEKYWRCPKAVTPECLELISERVAKIPLNTAADL